MIQHRITANHRRTTVLGPTAWRLQAQVSQLLAMALPWCRRLYLDTQIMFRGGLPKGKNF